MSPRTALLGLIWLLGIAGQMAAARQPDRISEEQQPAGRPGPLLILSSVVWDVMLDRLTIPLGTAEVSERDLECGA